MNPKTDALAQKQAEFCHILGNNCRVQIVWSLGNQQLTVGEIAEKIGASLQNTSQHLRLMKDKGILDSQKEGRKVYYWIANTAYNNQCPVIQKTRITIQKPSPKGDSG